MVERLTAERDAWKDLAMARQRAFSLLAPPSIVSDLIKAEDGLRALGLDPITGDRIK